MNTATTNAPTAAELATRLLDSDNLLRDIRLAIQENTDTERRAYHLSQISRVTAANHLMVCGRCRAREIAAGNYTPPEAPPATPPAGLNWPLGINPEADALAAACNLSHWSCWSPSDNSLWIRRDGKNYRHPAGHNLIDDLKTLDAAFPMGAPVMIERKDMGGIRITASPAESEITAAAALKLASDSAAALRPQPEPERRIELRGTEATLRTIISLGCGPDGRGLAPLKGSKIVRVGTDPDSTPLALALTIHGARHLWRTCTSRLLGIMRTVLFGEGGEVTTQHYDDFRALMRARKLLDAAFGASLPRADQARMERMLTDLDEAVAATSQPAAA